VINPFKRLPIYTESMAGLYMGKRKNEMPPHLWSNSDEMYRNMLQGNPAFNRQIAQLLQIMKTSRC
jgi:myosin protein heavy chain